MRRMLVLAQTLWLEVIRKKDVYVLLILMGALLVVLVSLNIFGLGGVVRYVKDLGLLMAWFFSWILAIMVTIRQLPDEENKGTIFPLLAKPVTRLELVAGKWLGAWTTSLAATLLFYLLIGGVVKGKGGSFDSLALLQGYLLHGCALGVIVAIALAFSTRMNPDAALSLTCILTGVSFVVVPRVPEFLSRESGFIGGGLMFLYNALPHFEVFDMRKRLIHDFGPAGWNTVFLVLLYGIALTLLFLLIAWLAYRNKRFSRSTLF